MPPRNSGRNLVCSKMKQRAAHTEEMQGVSQLCTVRPIIHVAASDQFSAFQSFTIFLVFATITDRLSEEDKSCQIRIDDATFGIKTYHLTLFQQYRPVSADFTKLSGGLGLTSMFANNENEKPSANNNVLLITCKYSAISSLTSSLNQTDHEWTSLQNQLFHPRGHCLKVDHSEHQSPLS